MAFTNTLFRPLIEQGRFYFALPPLYRVLRNNKAPVYLKDDAALDVFYSDELKSQFKFIDINSNKEIKESLKIKVIKNLRRYKEAIEVLADKYSIDPHLFELALLESLNLDSDDISGLWELDYSKIKLEELPNNTISLNGFFQLKDGKVILEENFLSLNHIDLDTLLDDLEGIHPLYLETISQLAKIDIIYKTNPFIFNSVYKTIFNILEKVNNVQITYLKGLGETDTAELRPTLHKDTRTLIRVMPTELDAEHLTKYMGKKSENKKELVDAGFLNLDNFKKMDI